MFHLYLLFKIIINILLIYHENDKNIPIDCLLCNGARPSCAGVGASIKGPLLGPISLGCVSSIEYDLFVGISVLP